MRYVFDIFLTEADYIDFNVFHLTRSDYGKRFHRRLRTMVAVIFAVAAIVNFLVEGISPVSVAYALFLVVMGVLLACIPGKFARLSVNTTIRGLKKSGKMPYSPESRLEFSDEGIQEITPEGRLEKPWKAVERLCILEGKVWYLFVNNTSGFILPVDQLKKQTDLAEFRRYLESRIPVVDVFEK